MRLTKCALAVVGAAVLLGALVSTASAGRLSSTTQAINVTWTRLSWRGGFGTVECEIIVNRTLHSRTIAKIAGALIGYITAVSVVRCARGSATILREALPWHVQYDSFSGTLPNITAIRARVIGVSFRVQEPVFGINCLSRTSAAEPSYRAYNREAGGRVTSVSVSGSIRCGEVITGTLEGTGSVTAHTVTLI